MEKHSRVYAEIDLDAISYNMEQMKKRVGEGGQLTEKVRRKPYSIVLLDEIEKARNVIVENVGPVPYNDKVARQNASTRLFRGTVNHIPLQHRQKIKVNCSFLISIS